jgi:hypothetical protein
MYAGLGPLGAPCDAGGGPLTSPAGPSDSAGGARTLRLCRRRPGPLTPPAGGALRTSPAAVLGAAETFGRERDQNVYAIAADFMWRAQKGGFHVVLAVSTCVFGLVWRGP